MRDYECSSESKGGRRMFSSKKQFAKADKFERETQIVKLFKTDMKKLLDYMREAHFQKQNTQMKLTTSSLVRRTSENDEKVTFS